MAKEWIVFSGAGPAGPRGEQGPSGSIGTPAPNITSATGAPAFSLVGHDTVVSFSGVITLPTADPHYSDLALIEVYAYPPSEPAVLIASIPAAMFGVSTVNYSGGQIPQPAANQAGWKLEFVCYNPGGSPTGSPYTLTGITVQGAAVTAVNDAGENPATRTLEENNLTACYPSFVPVLNGNQVPQTITYWLSKDNGSTYTHIGWIFIIAVGQVVSFSTLAPLAAQNWKIAVSAGAVPGDPSVAIPAASLSATAVVSASFAVSGLAAPGAAGITDASIGTTTYAQTPEGGWSFGQKGISFTVPADVNLWDVWLTVQLGRIVGGVFEGDPNTAEGEERVVKTWTEAGAAVTYSIAGWWIPPADYAYRVHRWRLRVRNRAEVLTLQTTAWSGVDHADVTPDPHSVDDYSFVVAPTATPGPDGVTVRFTPAPPAEVTSLGGFMIQVELPDQSSTPPTLSDGSVLSDGSRLSVGLPEPKTFGPYQYSASQLPVEVTVPGVGYACTGRVRIASISQAGIQKPWSSAPSATFAYTPATTPAKPAASNAYCEIATWGANPATASAPYSLSGKREQDIAFAGIGLPSDPKFYGWEIWSSEWPGDTNAYCHTGILTDASTVVTVDCPASVIGVRFWLRSCSIAADGTVRRNPLVPGATPSVVVQLGTTGGTLDLAAVIPSSTSAIQLSAFAGNLVIERLENLASFEIGSFTGNLGIDRLTNLGSFNIAEFTGNLGIDRISNLGTFNIANFTGNLPIGRIDNVNSIDIGALSGSLDIAQIGNLGSFNIGNFEGVITSQQVQDGFLADLAKFAADLRPITRVNGRPTLPDAGYPVGTIVLDISLATPALYKNVADVWTAVTASDTITGRLSSGDIISLSAEKLTGQINAGVITHVQVSQFAGTLSAAQAGAITIGTFSGNLDVSRVANINTLNIANLQGNLDVSRVANIGTLSIQTFTGTLNIGAQLADLSITSAKLQNITGKTVTLDLNGITTILNNAVGGVTAIAFSTKRNSDNLRTTIEPGSLCLYNAAGLQTVTLTTNAVPILILYNDAYTASVGLQPGSVFVNGVQVVGARQGGILPMSYTAAATYGLNEQYMLDSLQGRVNLLINRLVAHGLIDP